MATTGTGEPRWPGALRADAAPKTAGQLADRARDGSWDSVLTSLTESRPYLSPNQWRPEGISHYAPLHQAAWHGAPLEVVKRLVELGAWRTLRTADGRRPLDIALGKGHRHLAQFLQPVVLREADPEVLPWLDLHLAALVESRIRPQLDIPLRHPACEVLAELPDGRLWYPVPGMYGGFNIQLREDHLYVESWCRVVGGSGLAHVVTRDGYTLVRAGFC